MQLEKALVFTVFNQIAQLSISFFAVLMKKKPENLHNKKSCTTFATSNEKGDKNSSVAQSVRAPDC